MFTAFYADGDWYETTSGGWGDWFKPSHWHPLPAAPVPATEGETSDE